MVRAAIVTAYGEPSTIRIDEVEDPVAGPGEVLIRVEAIGVNFADTLRRRGPHPGAPQPPYIPGIEVSGTVSARGPRVGWPPPGARVAAFAHRGAYADIVVVQAASCYELPNGVSFQQAAAGLVNGVTAYQLLRWVARQRSGDLVLVTSAGGGVGGCAVQFAGVLGARRVIGLVRGLHKVDHARRLGAHEVFDRREPDVLARILAATGGRGFDVVLDSVGKESIPVTVRALAAGGRLVLFGQSSGPPPPIDFSGMYAANQSVLGYGGGMWRQRHPGLTRRAATIVFDAIDRGLLRVTVGATFGLHKASAAHEHVELGRTIGKTLLIPGLTSSRGSRVSSRGTPARQP